MEKQNKNGQHAKGQADQSKIFLCGEIITFLGKSYIKHEDLGK